MRHRHLNHEEFTLAAIDDVISRGRDEDWQALRRAVLSDPAVAPKVRRVWERRKDDRFAQRYHFWKAYVDRHSARLG